MTPPSSPPPNRSSQTALVGEWGEQLVCRWLQQHQWQILARRWHCRWGEIDIIARPLPQSDHPAQTDRLAFVEVKTRRSRNWDGDGRFAVTSQKQRKLWKTAQLFLSQNSELWELPCQFDVALVQCNPIKKASLTPSLDITPILQQTQLSLHQPISLGNYQISLLDYIESAFAL